MVMSVFKLRVVGMFQARGEDKPWIDFDADYDVSTLDNGETVLFKTSGIGPSQVEMWSSYAVTPQFVLDELERGRFRTHD